MLKLLNSVLLVITFGGIKSIYGESLQCEFQDVGFVWGSMYTCHVSSLENSRNNMVIKSHTGTHLANRNNNDVKAIRIQTFNTKYIPEGLGSLFSLTAFLVESSQLLKIKAENFLGMQNLEYLILSGNDLTSVPSDAFSTLTKLKEIYLRYNQIKYIGSGAFDQLADLTNVYLYGNICGNKPYLGATAITQMKEDIKANCDKPNDVIQYEIEHKITKEIRDESTKVNDKNQEQFKALNEMVKQLLIESKEHKMEHHENIKLRAELSTIKDLLMEAKEQLAECKINERISC